VARLVQARVTRRFAVGMAVGRERAQRCTVPTQQLVRAAQQSMVALAAEPAPRAMRTGRAEPAVGSMRTDRAEPAPALRFIAVARREASQLTRPRPITIGRLEPAARRCEAGPV
jgi:hypothetical protein